MEGEKQMKKERGGKEEKRGRTKESREREDSGKGVKKIFDEKKRKGNKGEEKKEKR